jgi:hypothetical protein
MNNRTRFPKAEKLRSGRKIVIREAALKAGATNEQSKLGEKNLFFQTG